MTWLRAMRIYVSAVIPLMLAWETAQLPFYTLWQTAPASSMAIAVLHCSAGDGALALVCLGAALVLVGDPAWPRAAFGRVLVFTVIFGVAATIYLEWLNVEVRRSWAYAELMPRLPVFGTGLTPILQWLVLPSLSLVIARHRVRNRGGTWRPDCELDASNDEA